MELFSRDEALAASTVYFGGDEMAADNFIGKYALRDDEDRILESVPPMMHRRLARDFARIEKNYSNPVSEDEIYELLSSWDIVAQGSPMSGIGNEYQLQSLSNCFVIPSPYDSYGGILYTDQQQAHIMKRRGGVGFDISPIRPKLMRTRNAARTTDGIGIFMKRWSNTCREVAQKGRRGALMLTISCHHPEIETFINIKRDLKNVTGANISIRWTDEFMRAVKDRGQVQLRWPIDERESPTVSKMVDAYSIWKSAMHAAWASAEPGALFWDTAQRRTPADIYAAQGFESISTNPCGEIILSAYDSCRLMFVNLWNFVVDPFTAKARFDVQRFSRVVKIAQRLMDDLIDLEIEAIDKIISKVESDPEPQSVKQVELDMWRRIKRACIDGRRTGLGITGLGDMLAGLGIKYGSEESIAVTETVYRELAVNSWISSAEMARDRGAFPVYDRKLEEGHEFVEQMLLASEELKHLVIAYGRRNIANTTTAPTGTTSTLTQTTSGIEPTIFIEYDRKKKHPGEESGLSVDVIDESGDKWHIFKVYHHKFKTWMDVTGKTDPRESPYWGATCEEIDWFASVKLQAAAQKWVCHAISKTCNMPENVTPEQVEDLYMLAWESGCKGFTIYRKGSRDAVISASTSKVKAVPDTQNNQDVNAVKRPKTLPCDIYRVSAKSLKGDGVDSYLVLVGLLDGRPYEIFAGIPEHVEIPKRVKQGRIVKNGKKAGIATYNLAIDIGKGDDTDEIVFKDIVNLFDDPVHGSFTRMISLNLRHRTPIHFVVEQAQKDKHSDITSFSRVIARVLKNYIVDGTKPGSYKSCPTCAEKGEESVLTYNQGCVSCRCGWSLCG